MQLDIHNAIHVYKELYALPIKSYKIDRAVESLETFIEEQLKEINPPKPKPSTTTDDEIPF